MIDFKQKLKENKVEKPLSPIDIYITISIEVLRRRVH